MLTCLDGKDSTSFQTRVSGSCAAGSSARAIGANGTVSCETDDDSGGDITSVTAGNGLTGGGASGEAALGVDFAGSGSASNVARADHDHDAAYQGRYQRTVVVSPVGTPAENGTALQNAMNSINIDPDGNPDTPPVPHLIRIEPGEYFVGLLTVKRHVDIEGSGEGRTRITGNGGGAYGAAIIMRRDTGLRFLTVEAAAANRATAIYIDEGAPRITHVTALASGAASNEAILALAASPVLSDVTAVASGGGNNYAIQNNGGAPLLANVTATASGGTGSSHAVSNSNSSVVMSNVVATASDGTVSYAVWNVNSTVTIRYSLIRAFGPGTNSAMRNQAYETPRVVTVDASQLVARARQ